MYERHSRVVTFRGILAAACLVLLVGCIPRTLRIAAAPTNLAATPGDAVVNLSWTGAPGASSYNIKRATAVNGPHTQVGSSSTTSFADTSVTNGTAYYYVVTSVAPDGESLASLQVAALPDTFNPPPTNFGTWVNVTPAGIDLTSPLCSNFGATNIQVDPAHPSNLYTMFHCQGIWKSTDYGLTWSGPINTGTNGAVVGDCSGGITISPTSTASVPTIYAVCIRGNGTGFWKSVDGGVNWTNHVVTPGGLRQDYYPPVVDPYDQNHLLMAGHEFDSIVESTNGGVTWTAIPLANGMLQVVRTGFLFFIDTGNAATTRTTWLWIGEQSGGTVGTWRTATAGATWTQVDKNEHPLGAAQIFQSGSSSVIYMAGVYSDLGWGVSRSNNYGQTWAHVGRTNAQTVVIGTAKNLYSMFGVPVGPGAITNPDFQVGAQPGTGIWVAPGTPASLTQGAAQLSVVNDGTNNILVGAMWNSGVWRYVEP